MVIGLEETSDKHLRALARQEVHLRGSDVAMHIYIPDVGGVDAAIGVLIVQGAWVSEPAPCALGADRIDLTYLCIHDMCGKKRHHNQQKNPLHM